MNFFKKLRRRHRVVFQDTENFEEKKVFKISSGQLFLGVGIGILVLGILILVLIAFTPLRYWIPGYPSVQLRKDAVALTQRADSLQKVVNENERYFTSIQKILRGEDFYDEALTQGEEKGEIHIPEAGASEGEPDRTPVSVAPSKADSVLRKEVEDKEKYNFLNPETRRVAMSLFPPVKGQLSSTFDRRERHFGVDISLAENRPVKATADGVVIFAEWTVETGYVIILDHGNGLVSVYKHNGSLTKKQGDYVRAGEAIAMSGNTGQYTTGPHLHFELWRDEQPIDPTKFINFE